MKVQFKSEIDKRLQGEIESLERFGCEDYSSRLGFAKVPKGYAVMLNADRTHFFWVRHDGAESCIHWNQWAVLKWIKEDAYLSRNTI